jgi:hypothetical protein
MIQSANELRTRIFEETESITFHVTSERLPSEIPAINDAAYQAGYADALIDAKIYFRMIIMRILGEKQ